MTQKTISEQFADVLFYNRDQKEFNFDIRTEGAVTRAFLFSKDETLRLYIFIDDEHCGLWISKEEKVIYESAMAYSKIEVYTFARIVDDAIMIINAYDKMLQEK